MIDPDEYPVYNHRTRPAIGRNHLGEMYFNCFSIHLDRDELGRHRPYVFTDFLKQYNRYKKHSGTCESCIANRKAFTFPAKDVDVDRSAADRKFSETGVDRADYYYCPLVREVLLASKLEADAETTPPPGLSVQPIQSILWGNWDDAYFFEFDKIAHPEQLSVCSVYREVTSSRFVATKAELSFLTLWISAMFCCMEIVRQSGHRVFFEEEDFDQYRSKVFDFIFPVPQVWVQVIPKPPPGVDWKEWERLDNHGELPQRVDFLFTYRGKRHIVEIDDIGHYGVKSQRTWRASEAQYRQTLADSRWLRYCNFEVHRFTNEEVLELCNPKMSRMPDVQGFVRLLRTEGLEPEDMVFIK